MCLPAPVPYQRKEGNLHREEQPGLEVHSPLRQGKNVPNGHWLLAGGWGSGEYNPLVFQARGEGTGMGKGVHRQEK